MSCAKLQVRCVLQAPVWMDYTVGPKQVLGVNGCDNPQTVCPRSAGEGYEKCQSVCGQRGHAEIQALRLASEFGIDLQGWTAYVSGHYHVCEPCARALRDAGITSIVIEVTPGHDSIRVESPR